MEYISILFWTHLAIGCFVYMYILWDLMNLHGEIKKSIIDLQLKIDDMDD